MCFGHVSQVCFTNIKKYFLLKCHETFANTRQKDENLLFWVNIYENVCNLLVNYVKQKLFFGQLNKTTLCRGIQLPLVGERICHRRRMLQDRSASGSRTVFHRNREDHQAGKWESGELRYQPVGEGCGLVSKKHCFKTPS